MIIQLFQSVFVTPKDNSTNRIASMLGDVRVLFTTFRPTQFTDLTLNVFYFFSSYQSLHYLLQDLRFNRTR